MIPGTVVKIVSTIVNDTDFNIDSVKLDIFSPLGVKIVSDVEMVLSNDGSYIYLYQTNVTDEIGIYYAITKVFCGNYIGREKVIFKLE